MENMNRVFLLGCALVAALSASAGYRRVTAKTAYADREYKTNGLRPASRTVDGSGMDWNGDYTQWTHGVDAGSTMWMGDAQATIPTYYVAEFESASTVAKVKFYNFNMNNGTSYVKRGLKQVNVYVSTDASAFDKQTFKKADFADTTKWTLVKSGHVIAVASGNASYTGDPTLLDLGEKGKDIRYFGLEIVSVHDATGNYGYGGLSEVIFLAEDDSLMLSCNDVSAITPNSATLDGKLSGKEGSAAISLYYGLSDGTAEGNEWDSTVALGVKNAGDAFTADLSELEAGKTYYATLGMTDGDGKVTYGAVKKFFTDSIAMSLKTVGGPLDDYESLGKRYTVTLTRSEAFKATTPSVKLTFGGTAQAGTDYQPPETETLTFEKDKTTVSANFLVLDDDEPEDDKTVVITMDAGLYGVDPEKKSVSFTILDDDGLPAAKTTNWIGPSSGGNWSDAENWDQGVPTLRDTVVFPSTMESGATIVIAGSASAAHLKIETTSDIVFDKAAEGSSGLNIAALTRPDAEDVTEGNIDFKVPVCLYSTDDETGICPWAVGGSKAVRFYADQARARDAIRFVKTGSAGIEFRYANVSMSLGLEILEGTATAYSAFGNSLKGMVIVGGGESPARLECPSGGAFSGVVPWVYTNGIFTCGTMTSGQLGEIHVYEGGYANVGRAYLYKAYLTGGRLVGGTFDSGGYGQTLTTYASDRMAWFGNSFSLSGYYDATVNVADGGSPIDLWMSGAFVASDGADKAFKRGGDGVVVSTSNMTSLRRPIALNAGEWYVMNAGSCALGAHKVTVNAGALLGGTGVLAGDAGTADELVVGGNASNQAVIAPGCVPTNGTARIYGTLSVGTSANGSKMTLNGYSTLRLGASARDSETHLTTVDSLHVYGPLTIKDGCTLDLTTTTADDLAAVKGGTYTIVSAESGITGTFTTELKPAKNWKVTYEEKRILLTIPDRGLTVIVR